MFQKQKLQSKVPKSISIEDSFCTDHYTRVWMKKIPSAVEEILNEIRVMCRIQNSQKCILTHYSALPEVNWCVKNGGDKFEKIVILSTHTTTDNRGLITLTGGEYTMITPSHEEIMFLPTSPDSSLLVFSFYTPSERRKKMDKDLEDLMS